MQRGYVLAILAALLASARVDAEPYRLIAIYKSASGKERDLRVPITKGIMLPDGGDGYRLADIIVHFKEEDLAATTLTAFREFQFNLRVGDRPATNTIKVSATDMERSPGREISLPDWTLEGQRDARTSLTVEVRSIYSADFLCLQERALMSRDGEVLSPEAHHAWQTFARIKNDQQNTPPAGSDTSGHKLLRTHAGGPFILYTFCKGPAAEDLNAHRDWDSLAPGKGDTSKGRVAFRFEDLFSTAKGQEVRYRHKRALVERLAERLNQFPSHFGQAMVDTTAKDFENSLLFVRDDYPISILKAGGAVTLEEESSGQVRPLADQLDQKSQVLLTLTKELCLDLPPDGLLKPPWFFELEVADPDAGGNRKWLGVALDFRNECARVLAFSWKDFLDQQVTFRIVFRTSQVGDLVVYRHSFHIYNFGLITIFPVASEIIGAATKSSLKDIESSSVIPISFALSTKRDRSSTYAVTFPFVLGVNTRSAPRLAEYIALAPSVSLIAGDAGTAPHVAFGFGLNLARAFHFGYAWAPDSSGDYVLIGVSIPELLPLLKNFGKGPGGH